MHLLPDLLEALHVFRAEDAMIFLFALAVPSKAYAGKAWLDHVKGCACCLTRTADVSPCYLRAKGCQDLSTLNDCCLNDMMLTGKNKVRYPQCSCGL